MTAAVQVAAVAAMVVEVAVAVTIMAAAAVVATIKAVAPLPVVVAAAVAVHHAIWMMKFRSELRKNRSGKLSGLPFCQRVL